MLKQTYVIPPRSISYVEEVIFGGRNCQLLAFSPETSGCAGQLSAIITTFVPCILILPLARATIPQKLSHPSVLSFKVDICKGGYDRA